MISLSLLHREFCKIEGKARSGFSDEETEMLNAFLIRINDNMKMKGDMSDD